LSAARLHALIVEDHSTSALSLKAALSVMGFATFGFAQTGPQAIAAAKARKPDLVVTSLSLRAGLPPEVLSQLAEEIDGAAMIYTCEPGGDMDGPDLILQKPVGRAALSRAWDTVRGEPAAA
jgi:CheY-like chemotaxis protein